MHSINLAFFFVLFLIYFSILLFLLQLITECPHIVDITPFTVFIAILFIATLLLQLSFIFTQFFFFYHYWSSFIISGLFISIQSDFSSVCRVSLEFTLV